MLVLQQEGENKRLRWDMGEEEGTKKGREKRALRKGQLKQKRKDKEM